MKLLITGTDTGVGKTFVTRHLALELKRRGLKVGCLKPVETGVEEQPLDGKALAEATGQPLNEVVPVSYRLPLAPYVAAKLEGRPLNLKALKEHFLTLKERYEVLLVEGAGGISVPLERSYDYAALAADWGLKLLIVARPGLGTLNHTYLTYHYARSKGLEVVGIVLSGAKGEDPSEETNPLVIEEMTGLRPLVLPYRPDGLTAEELKALGDYLLSGSRP
ncbi:MAG: dethiobiotin synthase [Aquificae bacterium]|nr:dethiobiotin synthase [Aquificota bacterium]